MPQQTGVPAPWFLLGLLVLAPMLAGLVAAVGRRRARLFAVSLAVLSLVCGATLAVARGKTAIAVPAILDGISIGRLLGTLDLLLLTYVAVIGYRMRKPWVLALAVAQLAAVVYLQSEARLAEESLLVIDGLATVMVLVVSVVGSLVALFALPYMREYEKHNPNAARSSRFFAVMLVFLGAMNAFVLVDNLEWAYFFWEITTVASFLLISHPKTDQAEANATYALTVNSLGGLSFAAALLLLSRAGGLSFAWVARGRPSVILPAGLLAFAAFTKAAQFPFQRWLTGAMVAPTPASALLHSSTMVKAAVYLMLRLVPAIRGTRLALAIAVFGAFTFFAASATAIGQANGKKVLAYSTIANLGLIIACAGVGGTSAISAAVLLVIFHATTKALLFLCIGTIEHGIGTRDIEAMEGVLWKMPVTTVITVLAMLAMVVPPFGMLIGKWLAIESTVRTPLVLAFFVLGSALTLVFWAKWIGRILTVSYHRRFNWEPLHPLLRLPKLILLAGVAAGSVGIAPLYNWLVRPVIVDQFATWGPVRTDGGIHTTIGNFLPWPMFLAIAAILLALVVAIGRIRPEEIRPPYLCGENADVKPGTSFFTARDEIEQAETGNYYLESVFGEGSVRQWANPLAIALLLLMAGLAH